MKKTNLDSFIDKLIDERGYADAPQEIKDQLHQDIKSRLDTFVVSTMIARFSPEEVTEYEKMLDEEKSTDELKKFAMDHIPDYQTFMTSTLLTFSNAYLS